MENVSHGIGPVGSCICPKCGYKNLHKPGIPCREEKCPQCGTRMIREGSYHYDMLIKKKGGNEK